MNERLLKNGRKGTDNLVFEQYMVRFLLRRRTNTRGVGRIM